MWIGDACIAIVAALCMSEKAPGLNGRAPASSCLRAFRQAERFVDQLLAGRHFLGELLVDRLAGGNEGGLVGFVHRDAGRLHLADQFAVELGGKLENVRLDLLGGVGEGLLHVGRQALPACARR